MKFRDLVDIVWKNMWKRKARTIFTMMGVIIGCLAVFIISSITNGFKNYLMNEMGGLMNTSIITITPAYEMEGEDSSKLKTKLNDKCIDEIKELSFIKQVIPKRSSSGMIKYKKNETSSQFIGSSFIESESEKEILFGRYPKENSNEVILGYDVAAMLLGYNYENIQDVNENELEVLLNEKIKIYASENFEDEDGKIVKYKKFNLHVVGIYKSNGNLNYSIKMPLNIINKFIKSESVYSKEDFTERINNYDEIEIVIDETKNINEYEEILKSMGYNTMSFKDFEESIQGTIKGVKLVLGSLAGISLMVAALGISNTMDMAIHERRKEIGIIKVIGGTINDVKKIFVAEACLISFLGGAISIVLGLIVDIIINILSKSITQAIMQQEIDRIAIPSISLIIGILTFSLIIGAIAGFLPANKAAKTDVITAIK
ncbi:ABC transporter permease [Clostridium ihumii]|uniref:ABC transporter permease n=1 Tax=Clostridium ihumii TaxID=1470356 RepID=UPI003D34C897